MQDFTPDLTENEMQRRLRISASMTVHAHSVAPKGSPENRAWWAWVQMRQRCFNPNVKAYKHYGGRGITVCPEWIASYVHFFAHVGGPGPKMTLDRFPDKNGNYEPGNVRWATQRDQNRNYRRNRLIKLGDQEKLIVDWIAESGLNPSTVKNRISRNGGVVDASVFEPLKKHRGPGKNTLENNQSVQ